MDSPVPRTRAITPLQKKTPARPRGKAAASLVANPIPTETTAAEDPPRRPRGRPRKTAEELDDGNRRRKLMDGAAKLFRTQGFAATSTRDIAAAAGMHSGSPFYHFESKSALLYAVMSEGMTMATQSQQQALEALPAGAAPRAQLRTLIRHHFEILLGPRSSFIPVMLYEWRSLTPAQRKGIARIKDSYEAAWMPALDALAQQGALQANPGVARLFIFGALNWAVQWFSPKKGKSLDALTDEALALFIRA
ncbi:MULTISPECIES: TetR/AcrR family transcriptional regulator [unclassified Acidovorax]|uniref:TetR/AcrR family transcriptional regulator n=1 Tax=unclassified Acidovorax TaxID=2684926 RepID=UPI001C48BCBD|nr:MULTISPECIES: TetR/AcrR family transcriptional regulator [unclassified Acidovorax]MBV7428743.1 TetR/AcrR family transcriptional regulator [Acidovorax sp. sif0732]MBV7450569.1 TetR/AcrR family transcriptional regulator [Acidovorax sp. sif0715]